MKLRIRTFWNLKFDPLSDQLLKFRFSLKGKPEIQIHIGNANYSGFPPNKCGMTSNKITEIPTMYLHCTTLHL